MNNAMNRVCTRHHKKLLSHMARRLKLFTFLLALILAIGNVFAETEVIVNDLKYLLDEANKTAKVTYKYIMYIPYKEYNVVEYNDVPIYWDVEVVNIPSSIEYNEETYIVKSIGENAFANCHKLKSITIPNSITDIESCAFLFCNQLSAVHISDIAAWCSINFNGSNPLSKAHNLYLNEDLITNLVIPGESTNINNTAFENCTHLHSVVISNGVTHINDKAFYNCDSLSSLTIPKSVVYVANDAFAGNTHLRSVTLYSDSIVSKTYNWNSLGSEIVSLFGDSVFEYRIGEGVKKIGRYAFGYGKNIRTVSLPSSVTNIGEYAFHCCSSLSSIEIPNSVTSIEEGAFSNCAALTTINIPNSITRIEHRTFMYSGLISINIPNSVTTIGDAAFYECKQLASITIPNGVKEIGGHTFAECRPSSIIIPNSVTNIGEGAFLDNTSLTSIILSDSLTSISPLCFLGCGGLGSIKIPHGVKSIGRRAFELCPGLKSITLPDSLTTIDGDAFRDCNHLDSVKIPHGVKSIARRAFWRCENLTSIELSDSLEVIGDSCFLGSRIDALVVPEKVKRVGYWALTGTNKVVLLPPTPPTINPSNPKYATLLCTWQTVPIYVPCGTLELYKNSEWSTHNIQYKPNEFEIIVSANDTLRGEVSVESNSCLTVISAVPYTGNYFVQWSDGSSENTRTITLAQDTMITAIFAPQTFLVSFVDDNDTLLLAQEYEYGTTPTPPADPIKKNDAHYSYKFAGWVPQIIAVTCDATYKATYTAYEKIDAIDDVISGIDTKPVKFFNDGNIYILMPDGKKYSIIGELVK